MLSAGSPSRVPLFTKPLLGPTSGAAARARARARHGPAELREPGAEPGAPRRDAGGGRRRLPVHLVRGGESESACAARVVVRRLQDGARGCAAWLSHFLSNSGQLGGVRPNSDKTWSSSDQTWPHSADCVPLFVEFGPMWVELGPTLVDFRPLSDQFWSNSGQLCTRCLTRPTSNYDFETAMARGRLLQSHLPKPMQLAPRCFSAPWASSSKPIRVVLSVLLVSPMSRGRSNSPAPSSPCCRVLCPPRFDMHLYPPPTQGITPRPIRNPDRASFRNRSGQDCRRDGTTCAFTTDSEVLPRHPLRH